MKIGDYVRFINEKQEGVVTKIIDHQLVGVTIEGDFEITVLASELVLVQNAEAKLREDLNELPNQSIKLSKELKDTLSIAVCADSTKVHLYHIYFINQSSLSIALSVTIQKKESYEGIFLGILEPNAAERISTNTLNDFDHNYTHHFQVVYYKSGEFSPRQPQLFRKNIKAKQVLSGSKDIPFLNTKGYYSDLESDSSITLDAERMKDELLQSSNTVERDVRIPNKEVDLHIEEITENFSSMDADAIFRLQLETFRRNLELAIAFQFQSMIFIHGVGNGTLRNEIHKQLGKHPNVKTFKDARKEKFGYGATEVLFNN